MAKIRNRYNQAPHQNQVTNGVNAKLDLVHTLLQFRTVMVSEIQLFVMYLNQRLE